MIKELVMEIFWAIAGIAFLSFLGLAMWKINKKTKNAINNMEEADSELVKAALEEEW